MKESVPGFTRPIPDIAVGVSRELLSELIKRHGNVGEVVSTMAHSPAVLGGYLQLSKTMRRAKFDRRTSEVISIAIQAQQGCGCAWIPSLQPRVRSGSRKKKSSSPARAPLPIPLSRRSSGSAFRSIASGLRSPMSRSTMLVTAIIAPVGIFFGKDCPQESPAVVRV